jgi:23S rRNA (adenine2030-N6)-methyltransferase
MLSYQHAYHAGSFADVIKHQILSLTLEYMTQKDSPLFYLETHGGRGMYDLDAVEAQKTQEIQMGILPLWRSRQQCPSIAPGYLELLMRLNSKEDLKYYPGSPSLAIHLLRSKDRLVINELHPQEFRLLKELGKQNKKVYFAQEDGIKQLNALLPPPEKRGLIFIDPAYEVKDEYKLIPKAIEKAYKIFSQGVYILWYPIINDYYHRQLMTNLSRIPASKILKIEFDFLASPDLNMHGCGLWVINPPYLLEPQIKEFLYQFKQLFPKQSMRIEVEANPKKPN